MARHSRTTPHNLNPPAELCSYAILNQSNRFLRQSAISTSRILSFSGIVSRSQMASSPVVSNSYGLRADALSPMETLAQSISTIAPTACPVVAVPLVCTLAGNGTWLAYLLATIAILLVAVCISHYARHSASPGSLYTYVEMTLPHWLSAVA